MTVIHYLASMYCGEVIEG